MTPMLGRVFGGLAAFRLATGPTPWRDLATEIEKPGAAPMTAYVIAEVDVTDPEAYKLYADKAPGVTQPAGGKYLARAGHVEALEGEPPKSRVVVIEFEDLEKARAFYYGRAYQEIIPLRQAASKGRLFLVDGAK